MFKYHFSNPRTLLLKGEEKSTYTLSFFLNQIRWKMKREREKEKAREREKDRGVNTIAALFYPLTRINYLPVPSSRLNQYTISIDLKL